jgi:hypothetical protein
MKYALLIVSKEKSTPAAYSGFLYKLQGTQIPHTVIQSVQQDISLIDIETDSDTLAMLVSFAEYCQAMYSIRYFCEDPTLFESKPKN